MKKTILSFCLLTSISCVHGTFAQKEKEKKWDVNNPPGSFKEVEFTTNEGTWMNLDVRPDGKEIAFDMLGDIYTMPITGGEAKLLRGGYAFEVQPRYSPDGKKISFTSDAGGGDNIWTMNTDGSNAKQITKESFRLLNNAVWTPDGQYLVARKHFTSSRSLGAGEMWMYHIAGGEGLQLTKKKNEQQDAGEPCISPDGRYIYFSEDMYPGGHFQYNKDANSSIYVIKRFDREKGEVEDIIQCAGGAFRPQISRDGKTLAFVRRVREKTVLYLHNLETGEEFPIYDKLTKDQQEAWCIFGVYTNFNWMPDNKSIVIWAGGKIIKISTPPDLPKGEEIVKKSESAKPLISLPLGEGQGGGVIPFTVRAKHKITDAVRFPQQVNTDNFTSKSIRQLVTSPDERFVIFNAAGYLWKKRLTPDPSPKEREKNPERLTISSPLERLGEAFEFEPSFSPDGNEIVFVSWNDEQMGAIWRMNIKIPNSNPKKLTTEKGIYRTPVFSPDGKFIVYQKEGGNDHLGWTFCKNPGIYLMKAPPLTPPRKGGEFEDATIISSLSGRSGGVLITKDGENPSFSKDGKKIFFQSGNAMKSYDINEKTERTIFTSKYANRFVPSPDNKWIAFTELHKVYIAPFPEIGIPIDLTVNSKSFPIAQVARDAGINLHWSADSKKLHWTIGDEYFTNELEIRFPFLKVSPFQVKPLQNTDSVPPMDSVGIKINLVIPTDKPKGLIALTGARIITMKGDEVIENGTILIDGNIINEIGKSETITIPKEAKIMDCKGKTIIPGLVDVHSHLFTFRHGLSPQKQWAYYANLAYGVTTTHDPSSNTEMVFSQSEMVKAGIMIGPRIYSTGTILYGADADIKAVINNLEDAKSAIRRTNAFGAFSVKSYNQPRREQRQQVIAAARELKTMVYPEGGSFFFHNMSMILDGHTGIEHNVPMAPLFNDVVQLWSNSKTGYTPTLIVCYGGMAGENYWYQKSNVWENKRLLNFVPRAVIDPRSRHRTMVPDEEYENGHILVSKACKKLTDAGVKVNLGSHGQMQGIGAHWELWMLAQGGLTPLQALRCATMNGADYIGMDKEIGSLEKGKLADLVVLDKNPLEDIQNTNSVRWTMLNGRLYDAETMNEIGNYDKKRAKFFWETNNYNAAFPWHDVGHGDED